MELLCIIIYLMNIFFNFLKNIIAPIYLGTVKDIGQMVDYNNKGVKGIFTDNVSKKLLLEYIKNHNINIKK